MKSSTCTLPPCSDLLAPPPRKSSVLDVNNLLSPVNDMPAAPAPSNVYHHHHQQQYYHPYERHVGAYREPPMHSQPQHQMPLKAKRKRASPAQLSVLNHVFSQTYFPSTELRIELGKQLGMSPRAVQIWFQNKRQSLRTRERQQQERKHAMASSSSSSMSSPSSGSKHHYMHQNHYPYYTNALPPISPPLSPPEQSPYHYQQHSYAEQQHHRRRSSYELLLLHVPNTPSSTSSYPSPTSIDSIILH
ncbi:hypothetical protein O0I10_005376 [Lichtheimia ornata]|uniref:Homeobox domain-containing protein n=1 Tax=Lichtheimia ornata TaxID=688661 RepID=A0AAD7V4Z8_9FUNG|nr:uncharacterized protein O0I10_005376 [Lichtheimia ornata]KAJ8658994.1 hypothetical protein O0I10_005376 [Lichtheimia ornata]